MLIKKDVVGFDMKHQTKCQKEIKLDDYVDIYKSNETFTFMCLLYTLNFCVACEA